MPSLRQSAIKPDYVEILFEAKPVDNVREELKRAGFRWAIRNKCWYGPKACLPKLQHMEFMTGLTISALATEPSTPAAQSAPPGATAADLSHTTVMPDGREIKFVPAVATSARDQAVDFQAKLERFRAMLQEQTNTRLANDTTDPAVKAMYAPGGAYYQLATTKIGRVYVNVDLDKSGKFMVEIATGKIFGIRGYGKVDKTKRYGTLDTIDKWLWGDFHPKSPRWQQETKELAEQAKAQEADVKDDKEEHAPELKLNHWGSLEFKPLQASNLIVSAHDSAYVTDGRMLLIADKLNREALVAAIGVDHDGKRDVEYERPDKIAADWKIKKVLEHAPQMTDREGKLRGWVDRDLFELQLENDLRDVAVISAPGGAQSDGGIHNVVANAHIVKLIELATGYDAIRITGPERPIAFYRESELVAVAMPLKPDSVQRRNINAMMDTMVEKLMEEKPPEPVGPVSWKVGCKSAANEKWTYNGLRFATKKEAETWGFDLSMRWMGLHSYEVHESDEPVNHRIVDGEVVRVAFEPMPPVEREAPSENPAPPVAVSPKEPVSPPGEKPVADETGIKAVHRNFPLIEKDREVKLADLAVERGEKDNVHHKGQQPVIRMAVAYQKGGTNFLTGKATPRGYVASAHLIHVGGGSTSFTIGGDDCPCEATLLESSERFNSAKLMEWARKFRSDEGRYLALVERVLTKSGRKLTAPVDIIASTVDNTEIVQKSVQVSAVAHAIASRPEGKAALDMGKIVIGTVGAPGDPMIQKRKAASKAMEILKPFMGKSQRAAVIEGCKGEEEEFFLNKMIELGCTVDSMPHTYQQEKLGDQAIVHLHYFTGAWDWYVTEKDKGAPDDTPEQAQSQAFGLVKGHEIEMGYISLPEILAAGAELDFHWKPQTVAQVRALLEGDTEEPPEPPSNVTPITSTLLEECDDLLAMLPSMRPKLTLVK